MQRGPVWIVIAVLGVATLAAASLADVGPVAEPPLGPLAEPPLGPVVGATLGPAAEPPLEPVAEPPLAYSVAPVPAGLDSLTSLDDASRQIEECADACPGIVYFWSPRMPLSRAGIGEIFEATRKLGMPLTLVGTEALHEYAAADPSLGVDVNPLADAMLGAGALAHAPALVVHEGGQVVGPAILGYKTAETYERMISRRISGTEDSRNTGLSPRSSDSLPTGTLAAAMLPAAAVPAAAFPAAAVPTAASPGAPEGSLPLVDYQAVGRPGAYFRWVPGRQAVAYESGGRIYLLDLVDGRSRVASGDIDFVPTPDGRYFVTPGTGQRGLEFYEADEVFEAAEANTPASVAPFYTDSQMRDQYPSVGILEQDESSVTYRVLTSWYAGIVYRDYEVQLDPRADGPRVRPIGEPVAPCSGMSLSTPIMSQDGTEVAARDESTGTTKIFRFLTTGRCSEVVDLGIQTGKVAWHSTGGLLAFARPRVRRRGVIDERSQGIFLFDRDRRRLTLLSDSQGASPLAFPDFVGDDSVVFLIPGRLLGGADVFRVIDGIR